MAIFLNPETLQAIRRPAEKAEELKEHGFVLFVPPTKEAEKPKAEKKQK